MAPPEAPPATARELLELNRRFYDDYALEFDAKRQRPWSGWEELVAAIGRAGSSPHSRLSVLDLGCGNARFCEFLELSLRRPFDYLGIDESVPLLTYAATALASSERAQSGARLLLQADVLEWSAEATYDVVVLFGVLHHIPTAAARRALLEAAADVTAPNGITVATFWQFDELGQRRGTCVGDPTARDFLLPWGPSDEEHSRRYCHSFTREEVDELTAGLGRDARFFVSDEARSASNLYWTARA